MTDDTRDSDRSDESAGPDTESDVPGPIEASDESIEVSDESIEVSDESTARRADGSGEPSEENPRARGEPATTGGAGGARVGETEADRAPLTAAAAASGTDRLRAYWTRLTGVERVAAGGIGLYAVVVFGLVAVGLVTPTYFLYLVSLAGIYVLLTQSLNVQWGYTGLINFSVAAFFGVGAYTAGVLASDSSPVTGGEGWVAVPVVGVFAACLAGAVLAVAIGVPTLSLRDDYLAIATLGLAEVVRIFVKNQHGITRGTRGLLGMPQLVAGVPEPVLDAVVAVGLAGGVWFFLRRVHRAPWGRVQRVIRTDEDLAAALGKNTFRLRMESFVVGGVIAALAGVVFVHVTDTMFPSSLAPIRTFYVWVAVILGGSGSDRGAILGGVVVVTIVEGIRPIAPLLPVDAGAVRLLLVGSLIVGVMLIRQEGLLSPQRELVWPGARRDE